MIGEPLFSSGGSLAITAGIADTTMGAVLFVLVLVALLSVSLVVGRRVSSGTDSRSTWSSPSDSVERAETTRSTTAGGSRGTTSGSTGTSRAPGSSSAHRTTRSHSARSDERSDGKRDRVFSLLEREGGQIRQSRIVEETGWSKTKVSRLLSSMAEDDAIVKIQIGRENLICLPGHVPSVGRDEGV